MTLADITPDVTLNCPVPVPDDINTEDPISLAVCAVAVPDGPNLTQVASARPFASTTNVLSAVAGRKAERLDNENVPTTVPTTETPSTVPVVITISKSLPAA